MLRPNEVVIKVLAEGVLEATVKNSGNKGIRINQMNICIVIREGVPTLDIDIIEEGVVIRLRNGIQGSRTIAVQDMGFLLFNVVHHVLFEAV